MSIQALSSSSTPLFSAPTQFAESNGKAATTTAAPVADNTVKPTAVAAPAKAADLKNSVEHINQTIQSLDHSLVFAVDQDSGTHVVKVIDTKTKDVIRQFPSQDVIELAKALDKLQGMLFRGKA